MADSNDPKKRVVGRDTIRSRLVLEVASELVDQPEWHYRQARVGLREQGGDGWPIVLFGSDSPAAIAQIASGEVQVAMINPAAPLALALRGAGPFREPIALRAIAVVPSPDQLAFAVTKQTKANSLREIRERRLPLRVSIRGQMDHSLHLVVKEVLSAAGFSLEEIAQYLKLYDADPAQIAQTQMLLARIETAIEDLQAKRADLDRTLKELKDIRTACVAHLSAKGPSAKAGCKG